MRRSVLIVGIGVLVIALAVWIYLPTLSRYRTLKMQQEQMERSIADLDERIKELTEEKELLQSDVQYIEKVIRDEMGLVKPGEVVYKFVTEKLKPKTAAPATAAPAEAEKIEASPAAAPVPAQ
ncbi:MAG: septum formation initiator family protein [Candidatus Omnitrophota bacterium]|jgi:cell division protein FtsB